MAEMRFGISRNATLQDVEDLMAFAGPCLITIVPPQRNCDEPDFAVIVVHGELPTRYALAALEVVNEMLEEDFGGIPA